MHYRESLPSSGLSYLVLSFWEFAVSETLPGPVICGSSSLCVFAPLREIFLRGGDPFGLASEAALHGADSIGYWLLAIREALSAFGELARDFLAKR